MTSSVELEKIASLACLDIDAEHWLEGMNTIMQYIEQLREVDTSGIEPLKHPLDLAQRLRLDEITEINQMDELKAIAPRFENGLYQVPKVIDTGK